jgi:hypothetical protein
MPAQFFRNLGDGVVVLTTKQLAFHLMMFDHFELTNMDTH